MMGDPPPEEIITAERLTYSAGTHDDEHDDYSVYPRIEGGGFVVLLCRDDRDDVAVRAPLGPKSARIWCRLKRDAHVEAGVTVPARLSVAVDAADMLDAADVASEIESRHSACRHESSLRCSPCVRNAPTPQCSRGSPCGLGLCHTERRPSKAAYPNVDFATTGRGFAG